MSSIFEEIDLKANQGSKFWCPLEEYSLRDIIENTLFRSKLKILNTRDQWKIRAIILTRTCLYYCKKNTEIPKSMSVIKWKRVEAFTEDNQTEERFGFKIGHGLLFQEFYTDNIEMLEK